ncbi:hypothetical protein VTK26DRAFT_2472 [Humicola hyalothermophila]
MSTSAPTSPTPCPLRPGLILVQSRPRASFSATVLNRWYDDKHIPDVLATPGVHAAARYRLLRAHPGRGDQSGSAVDDGECNEGKNESKNNSKKTEEQAMPYLAVYRLKDLGWLHAEGCEFWGLPLAVEEEREQGGREKKRERCIFEVAEFGMAFWEEVVCVGKEGERGAEEEEGGGWGEGSADCLVLRYLDAGEVERKDAKALLCGTLPEWAARGRVYSVLLKVDEARLGPPSVEGKTGDEQGRKVEDMEASYLCLHEIFNGEIEMNATTTNRDLYYERMPIVGGNGR